MKYYLLIGNSSYIIEGIPRLGIPRVSSNFKDARLFSMDEAHAFMNLLCVEPEIKLYID